MKDQVKEVVCGTPKVKVPVPWMGLCAGCHYGSILRVLGETIDELGIEGRAIGISGVGCTIGVYPMLTNIDFTACAHGRALAMGTGIKRVHPDAIVFTVQGDGDLGAIGLGCSMHAMIRGEKLTTIFLNNANYGMTGGQMAPTTMLGMYTTTTSQGRDPSIAGYPLHIAELAATIKGVAYSARCTVHTPKNFRQAKKSLKTAFQKQIDGVGYSIVEFLCTCPSNWKLSPIECLDFVENKMIPEYPVGEFKNVDSL